MKKLLAILLFLPTICLAQTASDLFPFKPIYVSTASQAYAIPITRLGRTYISLASSPSVLGFEANFTLSASQSSNIASGAFYSFNGAIQYSANGITEFIGSPNVVYHTANQDLNIIASFSAGKLYFLASVPANIWITPRIRTTP